jgi:hypothetical protein
MRRAVWIACASAAMAAAIQAQQPRSGCPPQGWSRVQLDTLKNAPATAALKAVP